MRHKKHHLPVIALVIVCMLLAVAVYFALFFSGDGLNPKDEKPTQMYAPESGLGAAEGGL
jgi:flagellar basal body-associated protein FliL